MKLGQSEGAPEKVYDPTVVTMSVSSLAPAIGLPLSYHCKLVSYGIPAIRKMVSPRQSTSSPLPPIVYSPSIIVKGNKKTHPSTNTSGDISVQPLSVASTEK